MFFETIKKLLKNYFIAGLLVVIPVAGTVWVLKALIIWIDGFFISLLPDFFKPGIFAERSIPGLGFALTIAIILGVGVITRLYLGKQIILLGDRIVSAIPFGRSIYQALKQITKAAFGSGEDKFKGVCLVEFPKEGSFALAFITNAAERALSPDGRGGFITVFVPTTPNPTSGYLLVVEESKVKTLNISTEDATKLIISGGLVGK